MPLKLNVPAPEATASAPTARGAGAARRAPRAPHSRRAGARALRRGAVGGAVAVALVGGGLVARHLNPPSESETVAASPVPVAVAAPVSANLGACVDRSFGLHRLGSQAISAIGATVAGYGGDRTEQVPRSHPVAAVAGLEVRVRVVRPDSYTTTDGLNEGITLRVLGTPGLATAEPPAGSPAATLDDYERAHTDTTEAVAKAAAIQGAASKDLEPLAGVLSEGSDITGCLFALARDSNEKPLSALVESDFADTALEHDDGTERDFQGDLSQVHLTVVGACSGRDPGRCEAHYQAFLDRAQGYGLDPAHVTRFGPGQVTDAPASWLSTGLDQVTVPTAS